MDSGVARKPIADLDRLSQQPEGPARSDRREPAAHLRPGARQSARASSSPRARRRRPSAPRSSFRDNGYGTPVLIARHERIRTTLDEMGLAGATDAGDPQPAPVAGEPSAIPNSSIAACSASGALHRDCQRMVNQDRNIFAACMVACGDADAHGDRRDAQLLHRLRGGGARHRPQGRAAGSSAIALLVSRGRSVFIADTTAHATPTGAELADIAMQSAARARRHDGAGAARRAAVAFQFRQSRPRGGRARARGGGDPRRSAGPISNMTAR